VQPEETEGVLSEFWTNSLNVVCVLSTHIEKRDSAPATPAEWIHTTPTYEPPKEQYDEESEDPFDVDFDESLVIPLSKEETLDDKTRVTRTKLKLTSILRNI
jgi:hypothetical protein